MGYTVSPCLHNGAMIGHAANYEIVTRVATLVQGQKLLLPGYQNSIWTAFRYLQCMDTLQIGDP